MGKAEFKIEGYLKQKADERGYGIYKITSPGKRGMPDRILVGKGITIYIETKSATGQLEPVQKVRIKELCHNGAIVKVANSRDKIDEILKWLDKQPDQPSTPIPF